MKWVPMPAMNHGRYLPGTFRIENWLYVFGGKTNSIERFDEITEKWEL